MAEYLKNRAMLQCSCGTIPSLLTVTSNPKIRNREGLFATHKDNIGGINISSFGLCAICKVCTIAGLQMTWMGTVSGVKILNNKPLLDTSKLICPMGGVISCLTSGQM